MREPDHPPSPPEIVRRLQFHREQWLLLPLMFAVPILALLGLLGGPRVRQEIDLGGVRLAVEFAPRDHLEDWGRMHVTVVNRAAAPLVDARAEFAAGLLDRLWRPSFHPQLARVEADWYVVPLGDVPSGARGQRLRIRHFLPEWPLRSRRAAPGISAFAREQS
ncbi:hypothetical protein OV079_31270 [Nannocystis pusilla]|uniref:Uncharacterized protein n=1 Tax=Nannocystis pusilla TaxID=889268 RepID=A0A9X3EUP3_9BACT|nr:hypothetical protein [Nannocystis pusilla]MCY1009965.1 hypothetical protein [Nannocystis pusilla]